MTDCDKSSRLKYKLKEKQEKIEKVEVKKYSRVVPHLSESNGALSVFAQ